MELLARFEAGDAFRIDAMARARTVENRNEFLLMELFETPWNAGQLPRELGGKFRVDAGPYRFDLQVTNADRDLAWRTLEHCGFTYEVCGESWLGAFRPARCRGLIDHLNADAFHVSYLPATEIPGERDEDWHHLDNEAAIAVQPRGTLVTSEGFEVVVGSAQTDLLQVRRVRD